MSQTPLEVMRALFYYINNRMCLITYCRLLFSGSILALDLIEDFLDMISQAINKDNDELTKSVSLRSPLNMIHHCYVVKSYAL